MICRCYPVTLHRCRLVCKKWRKIIDELDEGYLEPFRSAGHLRLYVCDRRRFLHFFSVKNFTSNFIILNTVWRNFRAILEKFLEHQPLSCSVRDLTSFRKTAYVKDCLAQVNEDISWDYQFDLTSWSQKYEIIEVDTFFVFYSAYFQSMSEIFTRLSSGRFERLADKLRAIQPLHIVFNDLSSYERRPTMLLFWFLKQLTNVRKLTFNCVRGDQKVEIDRILSVIGLDEINIIQPVYQFFTQNLFR
ncbi:unnamed protein product [Dracunculus medinensis]|uniref:F-box domain-containing protein n=1 Tax=Dracunculus medinensis TaxID=318479 RepID=A0A0N4U490_DRAME|nr:unnamed protein product [Dracunculus medinensis]